MLEEIKYELLSSEIADTWNLKGKGEKKEKLLISSFL